MFKTCFGGCRQPRQRGRWKSVIFHELAAMWQYVQAITVQRFDSTFIMIGTCNIHGKTSARAKTEA
jgi:hypothetical protein